MGNFKFRLKTMITAALITFFIALTFWGLGQNENGFGEDKNRPADFTEHAAPRPTSGRVLSAPGKEPVMPKGFKANAVWRDPFAAPAEITGAPTKLPPPSLPENSGGGLKPPLMPHTADLPLLTGVVSSGSRQMAIIRYKGVSRAYSEGEQVGNYRLAQIAGNVVILEDHTGELAVRLP